MPNRALNAASTTLGVIFALGGGVACGEPPCPTIDWSAIDTSYPSYAFIVDDSAGDSAWFGEGPAMALDLVDADFAARFPSNGDCLGRLERFDTVEVTAAVSLTVVEVPTVDADPSGAVLLVYGGPGRVDRDRLRADDYDPRRCEAFLDDITVSVQDQTLRIDYASARPRSAGTAHHLVLLRPRAATVLAGGACCVDVLSANSYWIHRARALGLDAPSPFAVDAALDLDLDVRNRARVRIWPETQVRHLDLHAEGRSCVDARPIAASDSTFVGAEGSSTVGVCTPTGTLGADVRGESKVEVWGDLAVAADIDSDVATVASTCASEGGDRAAEDDSFCR